MRLQDSKTPMEPDETSRAAFNRVLSPLLPVDSFRPLSSTIQVEIGALSHSGKAKLHNEDNYLVIELGRSQKVMTSSLSDAELPRKFDEHAYIMLVADGLGGHGSGGMASRLVLSTFAQLALHFGHWNIRVDPQVAEEILERTEWVYERLRQTIVHQSLSDPGLSTLATTLTAAYSAGDDLFISHVGHSRAYLYREGELTLLTRDHTLSEKIPAGPSPIQHVTDDVRHILTDALGGRLGGSDVDIEHFRLAHGDCILVCTNGLTDMVDDAQIANVLTTRQKPDAQCQTLVDLALQGGGNDNVTVILAQYAMPRA